MIMMKYKQRSTSETELKRELSKFKKCLIQTFNLYTKRGLEECIDYVKCLYQAVIHRTNKKRVLSDYMLLEFVENRKIGIDILTSFFTIKTSPNIHDFISDIYRPFSSHILKCIDTKRNVHNSLKIKCIKHGIQFHHRVQKLLSSCSTLYDFICTCFGPVFNKDQDNEYYRIIANEFMISIFRSITSGTEREGFTGDTDVSDFAKETTMACQCEVKLGTTSESSGFNVMRRPDCLLLFHNKGLSTNIICQCLLEFKSTPKNCKGDMKIIHQQSRIIKHLLHSKKYSIGSQCKKYQYYTRAINQTIDFTGCVINYLKQHATNKTNEEHITVKFKSFLMYGSLKQPLIHISVECPVPRHTNVTLCADKGTGNSHHYNAGGYYRWVLRYLSNMFRNNSSVSGLLSK